MINSNMFDVLIIGGGVSGMSCALVLGSAKNKPFVTDKKIGIIAHQKNSASSGSLINNAYGIPPGKLGSDLLSESIQHLSETYPHINQIPNEKVLKIEGEYPEFTIITNKNTYKSKMVVIGIGAANTFAIEGLMHFVEPHQKALTRKTKNPTQKQRPQSCRRYLCNWNISGLEKPSGDCCWKWCCCCYRYSDFMEWWNSNSSSRQYKIAVC